MPILNGLDAAWRVKRTLPNVKIIFVTVNPDPSLIAEAFRRGASAYLLKTSAASELVTAIRHSLQGRVYLSPSLATSASDLLNQLEDPGSTRDRLTDRQVEVLQLLAEGRSMKEAAALLILRPARWRLINIELWTVLVFTTMRKSFNTLCANTYCSRNCADSTRSNEPHPIHLPACHA